MPFGGGPQICLGMEFARTKMVVFLHHLVLNYEWPIVNPNEGVVQNPLPVFQKGLPLKIKISKFLRDKCLLGLTNNNVLEISFRYPS
ncbi:unnamed protein product [Sphagnum tenellum]